MKMGLRRPIYKTFQGVALSSTHRAGDCIYRIGDRAQGLYLSSGVSLSDHGKERAIWLFYRDRFFWRDLATHIRPPQQNIYAETDCSVPLLDRERVEAEVDAESPLVKLVLDNILNAGAHESTALYPSASSFHEVE